MVRYIRSNQVKELTKSVEGLNPIEKRILDNVLEYDTVDIILNDSVWYVERGSLPKYAKEYLKKYIKSRFGADYLYDVA